MNKLFKLILFYFVGFSYSLIAKECDLRLGLSDSAKFNEKAYIFRKKGCCYRPSKANYTSINANSLIVNNNAVIKSDLDLGGTLTTSILDITDSLAVNGKNPVLGSVESLTDLRFTIMMPGTLGLSLTASSAAPAVVTASLSGAPTPTRIRGFGTSAIGALTVTDPAINLASSGFSLLFSSADAGTIATAGTSPTADITTVGAILVNLMFNVFFFSYVSFSDISSFNLPVVSIAFENLGPFVNTSSPGAYISNATPYITNLTNTGFTVNIAISVIGSQITVADNVTAMATAVSNFIQNAYLNFIIQGS